MYYPSSLLLGSLMIVPASEQVPTFNVAASCKAAVEASVGMSEAQSYASCMKEESDTRDQLVRIWPSFSAAHRQSCTDEASSAGTASYVDLIVCLQIARDGRPDTGIQIITGARKKKP
jgi:hypothetical protein